MNQNSKQKKILGLRKKRDAIFDISMFEKQILTMNKTLEMLKEKIELKLKRKVLETGKKDNIKKNIIANLDASTSREEEEMSFSSEKFQREKKKLPKIEKNYENEPKNLKVEFCLDSENSEEEKYNKEVDDEAIKSLKSYKGENQEIYYYQYSDSYKKTAYYKCWDKSCQGRAKAVISEKNKKKFLEGSLMVLIVLNWK